MKSGKGSLSSCPYCEEFLEFKDRKVRGSEIIETYICPICGRRFEVVFRPVEWREDEK